MTRTVPAGTVTDTTSDPQWEPVTVVAHLADPIVALDTNPLHLDGPLSWAAAMDAHQSGVRLSPIQPDWAPDLTLPLATWTTPWAGAVDPRLRAADRTHVWGWACSAAIYDVDLHTRVEVRRKPAVDAMARFAPDTKHHLGLGPHKARNVVMPATAVRHITWHALADRDRLAVILTHITHLGRIVRHGHGRINRWEIRNHHDHDAWARRLWPHPDGLTAAIRAPYWHHSRTMPCSSTRPA